MATNTQGGALSDTTAHELQERGEPHPATTTMMATPVKRRSMNASALHSSPSAQASPPESEEPTERQGVTQPEDRQAEAREQDQDGHLHNGSSRGSDHSLRRAAEKEGDQRAEDEVTYIEADLQSSSAVSGLVQRVKPYHERYVGQVRRGRWEGRGRLVYSEDDPRGRIEYHGQFRFGRRHGQGKLRWRNGCVYKGEWKEDMMQGLGTMKWPTGQVYTGEWENNQMHGEGLMTWQNPQVKYVGAWYNGKRSGRGRITFADDDEAERVYYDGDWQFDRKEGNGEMVWKSGSKYCGEWRAGLRDGLGVHTFHNGDRYIGTWCKDKRTGKGELLFANGDKFEGEWVEDRKQGKGTYTYAHGRIRHETWQQGCRIDDPKQKYLVQSLVVLCVEYVGSRPELLQTKQSVSSEKRSTSLTLGMAKAVMDLATIHHHHSSSGTRKSRDAGVGLTSSATCEAVTPTTDEGCAREPRRRKAKRGGTQPSPNQGGFVPSPLPLEVMELVEAYMERNAHRKRIEQESLNQKKERERGSRRRIASCVVQ